MTILSNRVHVVITDRYERDMKETGISDSEAEQLNQWRKKYKDIKITESSFLGTPEAFETISGSIVVECKRVRFLGGGISNNLYMLSVGGDMIYSSMNFSAVMKRFYNEYKKEKE